MGKLSEQAKLLRTLRRKLRARGYTLGNAVLFDINGQHPLPGAIDEALRILSLEPDSDILHKPSVEKKIWRCFHCDEVFTDRESAQEHFGKWQIDTPACVLSKDEKGLVGLLREALEELRDFRNGEDNSSRRREYGGVRSPTIRVPRDDQERPHGGLTSRTEDADGTSPLDGGRS